MIISATVTLTNADTGYSLLALLQAITNIELPTSSRVASLKIQRDDTDLYLVPLASATAYSAAGGVPAQFGWKITSTISFEEINHPANQISLADINMGCGTAGKKAHIWAYTV